RWATAATRTSAPSAARLMRGWPPVVRKPGFRASKWTTKTPPRWNAGMRRSRRWPLPSRCKVTTVSHGKTRMNTSLPYELRERLRAARPFLLTALLALLFAGFVAAAIAHAPTRSLVWMVAYLVLVAGVAQGVLGLGQALLPGQPPASRW